MPVTAQPAHFAAPVGGWNSIDAIAGMPATDAVRMDNFFPETAGLRLRRGSMNWYAISGAVSPIQSLMTYSSVSGDRLLAAVQGYVFDITLKIPSSILTNTASDYWQYVNFSTPGGQFWVGVNGTAKQWVWQYTGGLPPPATAGSNTYDSSVPSTPGNFSTICSFQSRLFFTTDQDLYLYYLPVNVFQGEVHAMDLGGFLPLGGKIVFLGTWTRDDSTMGMNDLLVIGTDKGEVLVYRGVDPDDPSNWFMVGRFECGRPVSGHRQLCRLGPDMLMINQDGFQSMANYLSMGQSKALSTAISYKIGNTVTQAILSAGTLFGWEAILYPAKNALLVNVPQPGGGFQQYVVNTLTGAWCRFLGLDAYCWTVFQGNLMFGTSFGTIVQADIGGNDNGVPIAFDLCTAFQVFGGNLRQKRATMARPFMIASGQWYPVLDVNVDYTLSEVTSPLPVSADETNWNQFNWDNATWGSTGTPQHNWYSVQGIGTSFSIRMSGTAQSVQLQLMAFDLAYEPAIGFV